MKKKAKTVFFSGYHLKDFIYGTVKFLLGFLFNLVVLCPQVYASKQRQLKRILKVRRTYFKSFIL